jgi:hypothetical protein
MRRGTSMGSRIRSTTEFADSFLRTLWSITDISELLEDLPPTFVDEDIEYAR